MACAQCGSIVYLQNFQGLLPLFLSLFFLFSIIETRKCNEFLFIPSYVKQWNRKVSCTGLCSSLNVKIGNDVWYLGRCDTSPSYCPSHGRHTTKVLDREEFGQLVGKDMLNLLPTDVKTDIVSTVMCCSKDYCNEPNINTNFANYLLQTE